MVRVVNFVKSNKLGALAVSFSLTFMFLGLPSQIMQIWTTRSVKEISIATFSLLAVQSFFWILYGFKRRDLFIVLPNLFGTIFATIIVIEYFLFR